MAGTHGFFAVARMNSAVARRTRMLGLLACAATFGLEALGCAISFDGYELEQGDGAAGTNGQGGSTGTTNATGNDASARTDGSQTGGGNGTGGNTASGSSGSGNSATGGTVGDGAPQSDQSIA